MDDINRDVIIIGSGPAGYTAAIRCAQLGLIVCLIEKDKTFGGTCLNVGCIPSKALLDSTVLLETAKNRMKNHGIIIDHDTMRVDLQQMMERKNRVVAKMTDGVKILLQNYKVETIEGTGKLKNDHTVVIRKKDGTETEMRGNSIILATGSVPIELPVLAFDHKDIVDSTDALSFDTTPLHLAIIGAGAIGLEIGSIWNRLGAHVTIVEMMDQILPQSDANSCSRLFQLLKKQGLDIRLQTTVISCEKQNGKVALNLKDSEGKQTALSCDKVLAAAGRRPNIEGLGLDEVGVKFDSRTKRISVNNKYQTSVPSIYAIGDVIQGPMLAHKASEEGIAIAEIIANRFGTVNYETIPSVVYTWPEYAAVGQSEAELTKKGAVYKSGIFQFRANGRALADDNSEGFVKIFSDAKSDRLLGAQIIGPWASDLISEVVTVMEFEGTAEDIARTIHAHPTLSEVVREAAMDADNRSIHTLPKKII